MGIVQSRRRRRHKISESADFDFRSEFDDGDVARSPSGESSGLRRNRLGRSSVGELFGVVRRGEMISTAPMDSVEQAVEATELPRWLTTCEGFNINLWLNLCQSMPPVTDLVRGADDSESRQPRPSMAVAKHTDSLAALKNKGGEESCPIHSCLTTPIQKLPKQDRRMHVSSVPFRSKASERRKAVGCLCGTVANLSIVSVKNAFEEDLVLKRSSFQSYLLDLCCQFPDPIEAADSNNNYSVAYLLREPVGECCRRLEDLESSFLLSTPMLVSVGIIVMLIICL